ncbi:protein-export chaperone SecB [Lysobacter panacisoli]|uniref:Preprotein translocase subunit SecB n=1 Tax=Lysobacter panacisoli TaxID=1255263 RepID=A0ABP9LC98_9GAMM|nr:protein-export chaperone SecB [Lysobacter panacisoli]
MAKKTKVFDPTEYFALHDIALWTTSLQREAEFQPELHEGKTTIQTMRSVKAEGFTGTLETGEELNFIQALVTFGIRSVFGQEEGDSEVLHSLEATFAVDYQIIALPDEKDFQRFLSINCPHQAWPFWRQHVYDTFKRASLPVPLVPLLSSGQVGKRPRKVSRIVRYPEPVGPTAPAK